MSARGKTLTLVAVPGALLLAAVVCAVAAATGGGAGYAWTAIGLVIVAFWIGLVLLLAVRLRARMHATAALLPTHTAEELEAADKAGRLSPARVVSITGADAAAPRSVVSDITVVIAPAKGKPYTAELRRLISPDEAKRVQPDSMVCVLEPARGATGPEAQVELVLDPPTSWRPSSARKRIAREAPAPSTSPSSPSPSPGDSGEGSAR